MPFQNRQILFIASGILIAASLLYITANALPIWGKISVGPVKTTFGLWQFCISNGALSGCVNWPSNLNDENMSARVFMIICCILSSLSVPSILSILFVKEDSKRTMCVLSKALAIASLISGIIGVAVGISFALKMAGSVFANIGVSSILGIIAVGFNLAGVIATLIIK